ncbi:MULTISPECIES: hypothetical protein [Pseudomonadaceae]|uniref:Uncharacterized protein n=1 Tax=Metapseudomonas otitidis TaxID=319939 RepID=A0A1I0U147_9GAMM|nr:MULTISPECIES: hypothetical protein [Pseudomonas]MDL5599199.1 hypothetical protein [Bacillus subtilis]KIV65708.1 hypothetical protein SZ55_3846 [Pseudomonas sp. FeS53a]MBO2927880.1 hypothetical protein [Pseudomonas otitidis]MCO7556841.1 hypothetical protein [Pseudomonas otitidis]MCP1619492.1 hypothetical protein [Pseudomonas otitidis]
MKASLLLIALLGLNATAALAEDGSERAQQMVQAARDAQLARPADDSQTLTAQRDADKAEARGAERANN